MRAAIEYVSLPIIFTQVAAFTAPTSLYLPSLMKPASTTSHNTFPSFIPRSKDLEESLIPSSSSLRMSFYSDSSDYKSSESDFSANDEQMSEYGVPINKDDDKGTPSIELTPVPMSKNAGNRFVAVVLDKDLMSLNPEVNGDLNVMEMHQARIALTEEHVMFTRKTNLYNETFNTESMADILWSHQLLASDMKRVVGHVMCIESTAVEHAQEVLSRDPIVKMLTGGDVSNIPFYRWRHLRDWTLRNDDGRDGKPTLLLAMDRIAEEGVGDLREESSKDHLEYLIRSGRVIATGPLHLPTEFKDDPSSLPVGDLLLFNTNGREDAVNFVENDPSAKNGLYESMRVFRCNSIDVTGKFVAENLLDPEKNKPTADVKEAMEYWGYPVDDMQTNWLNS